MIEIPLTIINIGGGIAGYASVAYLLWRKFKKDIKLFDISGAYQVEKSNDAQFDNIIVTINVGFLNKSDETISVTDLVGVLKYNKKKHKEYATVTAISNSQPIHTERPINFQEVVGFTIAPHELVKKTIKFRFSNMILSLVDRIGFAHFVGFLNGKIPLVIIDEKEYLQNWEKLPLNLLIVAHINGKKLVRKNISIFKKEPNLEGISGSLNVIDIAKIEKSFLEGRY